MLSLSKTPSKCLVLSSTRLDIHVKHLSVEPATKSSFFPVESLHLRWEFCAGHVYTDDSVYRLKVVFISREIKKCGHALHMCVVATVWPNLTVIPIGYDRI